MSSDSPKEAPALLIRRFDKKNHALQVNRGILGCRDLLSCLFAKSQGGYTYVDYYEELFARETMGRYHVAFPNNPLIDKSHRPLVRALCNPMIAGIYMTFTHAVDKELTFLWLDDQDDNGYYAFLAPHYQFGHYLVGHNKKYIISGTMLDYVSEADQIDPSETLIKNPWPAPALDDELSGMISRHESIRLIKTYQRIIPTLFNRVMRENTSPIENEFRLLLWERRFNHGKGLYSGPFSHSHFLTIDGERYRIEVPPVLFRDNLSGQNTFLLTAFRITEPLKPINPIDLLNSCSHVEVPLTFRYINLNLIADRWGYIGNKEDCRRFVDGWLLHGDRRRSESEHFHRHHGPWPQSLIRRTRSIEDVACIIPSAEKGYYSNIGN